jgi:hypothetical protein
MDTLSSCKTKEFSVGVTCLSSRFSQKVFNLIAGRLGLVQSLSDFLFLSCPACLLVYVMTQWVSQYQPQLPFLL